MRRLLPMLGALGAATAFSVVAEALPWDVDMVDGATVKGYECWRYDVAADGTRDCVSWARPLPIGVVSQANELTPSPYRTRPALDQDWSSLKAPYGTSPEVQQVGQRMFTVYCQPCHSANGTVPGVVAEKGIAVLNLAGTDSEGYASWRNKRDGTVRNAIAGALGVHPSELGNDVPLADLTRDPDALAAVVDAVSKAAFITIDPAAVTPLAEQEGGPTVGDLIGLVPDVKWRLPFLTDGDVYRTIRIGSISGIMPDYGWAMTDEEIWSVISHVRTLPNAAYVPEAPLPPPPGEEAP